MKHDNSKRFHRAFAPDRPNVSRRHFLQGLGVCVALPVFESWIPRSLRAAETASQIASNAAASPLATTATGAPLRMAFVYFPNGARQDYWWPKVTENDIEFGRTDLESGASDFQFGRTMQSLEKLREQRGARGAGIAVFCNFAHPTHLAPGRCASRSKRPCSISLSCVSRLRSVIPSSVSKAH